MAEAVKLTEDEKKVLMMLLDEHIGNLMASEEYMNTPPILLSAELKYEDFLRRLKDKLR